MGMIEKSRSSLTIIRDHPHYSGDDRNIPSSIPSEQLRELTIHLDPIESVSPGTGSFLLRRAENLYALSIPTDGIIDDIKAAVHHLMQFTYS